MSFCPKNGYRPSTPSDAIWRVLLPNASPDDAETRVGENARRVRRRVELRQAREPHLCPVVVFQVRLSERLDGLLAVIEPDRHFSDERRAERVEQGIDDP